MGSSETAGKGASKGKEAKADCMSGRQNWWALPLWKVVKPRMPFGLRMRMQSDSSSMLEHLLDQRLVEISHL